MKLHLASVTLAAAMIAALPASADSTMVIGEMPAATCARQAMAVRPDAMTSIAARHDALNACDAALAGNLLPTDRTATLVNRGILNAADGNTEAAIADYDAALALAPEMANAYLNRGVAFLHDGRFDAARADFDRAIALKTDRPAIAYFDRGMANEDLGDLLAAYHDYRQAQNLAPDFAPARIELTRFKVKATEYAAR